MATTYRTNKKATKIAFDILGVPANLRSKKTEKEKEQDSKILWQGAVYLKS